MKIRTATKPNAKNSYTVTRNSNIITIWADQGKDWRKEQQIEFPTVRLAKQFMNRPQF